MILLHSGHRQHIFEHVSICFPTCDGLMDLLQNKHVFIPTSLSNTCMTSRSAYRMDIGSSHTGHLMCGVTNLIDGVLSLFHSTVGMYIFNVTHLAHAKCDFLHKNKGNCTWSKHMQHRYFLSSSSC